MIPDATGIDSLSPDLMADALRLAYGAVPDVIMERRCRGIIRVSQLLATGADALARIHAVRLGFPQIAPDGMAKLAAAASLRKYNPDWQDQTRVPAGNSDGDRWTSDANGGRSTGAAHSDTAMSPDCAEEWATARLRCLEYRMRGRLGTHSGFGRTYQQCVRGYVSARCGGNAFG